MESTFNNFESTADAVILEGQQSEFTSQMFSSPGGDDDEEDGGDDDESKGSDDGNPPLDEEVVHSPLPTQTGGKPK